MVSTIPQDAIDRAIEASIETHKTSQDETCSIQHTDLSEEFINEKWREVVSES